MLLVALRVDTSSLWHWVSEPSPIKNAARRVSLIGLMGLAMAVIAGLAYWDSARESGAALDELAEGQGALATTLAAALRAGATGDPPLDESEMLRRARTVGSLGATLVLLHRPGDDTFATPGGGAIRSAPVLAAINRGTPSAKIPRNEAAALGLPARAAVAGIARVDRTSGGTWDIITVASAEHERDRETWARRRLVLSVLAAAALVVLFGGLAMRNQRKELVLERELAVAAVRHSRDERLQRASKAAVMGTLAMGVAHEISTPLGVIAARAEQMVPRAANDNRLSDSLAAILAQTDHIKQVIRGLLGLARGDAPSAERIEPRAVVEQAVGLVEHRFSKARVRLTQAVEPRLPNVLGDPRLLEHAVVNLLLNACDACQSGDEVIVRAERWGADVQVAVEDMGTGISLADLGRAREPFFTTKARGEGTGLGLAIAHEIVASHRGSLQFSPREPRGTIAAIRLPPAEGTANA
jgi:two-component system, NtrC family, sensor kinase